MLRNRRSVWNVRAMPRWVILCGSSPTMLRALEHDVALDRLVDAGDEVEERRLAGAVRPDHAHDLALVDMQVEAVDARAGPPNAIVTPRSSSSAATRRSPRAARRAARRGGAIIRPIEHRAEQDVARRLRLREHHVLPDERREVQRRDEHARCAPIRGAGSGRSTSDDQRDVGRSAGSTRRGWPGRSPSPRPSRRACCSPRAPSR